MHRKRTHARLCGREPVEGRGDYELREPVAVEVACVERCAEVVVVVATTNLADVLVEVREVDGRGKLRAAVDYVDPADVAARLFPGRPRRPLIGADHDVGEAVRVEISGLDPDAEAVAR